MWRVIIAEDERLFGATLRAMLEAFDIAVVGAAQDGQAALELCHQTRPDVVVMDLRMPVMDGVEATRRIMAECPTRVIILTGVDAPAACQAALAAGAEVCLKKPVVAEEVAEVIRKAPGAAQEVQAT